ncbi:MAG: Asp-tRNA(Asn)/Glu-tRNA(Gln) amidotransferase subunit GatA [Patescibacteria group bacterium]|nr:Asp-tRNA(Asn)/Glu-tRNA(Gln) amidotransferase subunit GatA [Patescibacteria group bacterium]
MPEFKNLTVSDFKKLFLGGYDLNDFYSTYLDWLKAADEKINGFLYLTEKTVAQSIAEIKTKPKTLPLWGVPVAIKDAILVKSERATSASKILENFIAPYDATVVKKIKAAGGIIVGKTNMDEFAMGSSTENSAFKKTKNPFDPERIPGGSSGGSAAVVGAGLVPLSLGSDTGGSIRQPASFCDVYGLKPTYGAVSRYGLMAMASSLDQIGPFSRRLEDLTAIFDIIRGADPKDSTSQTGPASNQTNLNKIKKKLKLGLPIECFDDLDPKIKNLILEKIKSTGLEWVEISLNELAQSLACYYLIMPAEASANLARYDGIRYGLSAEADEIWSVYKKSRRRGFGQEVVRRIILGTFILSHGYYDAYYLKAQKLRQKIFSDFKKALTRVDLILMPTSPSLPFKFEEKTSDPLAMYLSDIYTVSANLAGIPSLNIPIGLIEPPERTKKLPVGLQVIAGLFEENKIFSFAKILEDANH